MPGQISSSDDTATLIAHNCFVGLRFQSTSESLERSFIAKLWKMGVPHPQLADGTIAQNPWSEITVRYHFEEALARCLFALEAELLVGFVSYVIQQAHVELGQSRKIADVTPQQVLQTMIQWSLVYATERARFAGSPGVLSTEEATGICSVRVVRYEHLFKASAQCSVPLPSEKFQLGLSRDHPWTAPICYMADNICDALPMNDDQRDYVNILMQSVISGWRTSFYKMVQELNPH